MALATVSEISRLRNYFTLSDDLDEIICDYCSQSYDIEISTEEVKEHLEKNKEDHPKYNDAVSPKTAQEDLKEYYTIENNTIKCKFCDELYNPSRTHSIIRLHLEVGHGISEIIADRTSEWLPNHYNKLDESDEYRCNKCNIIFENKSISLLVHIKDAHKDVEIPVSFIPGKVRKENRLDSIYESWTWDFFTKINEVDAKCGICDTNLKCYKKQTKTKITKHLEAIHKEVVVKSEELEQYYSEVGDHQLKCFLCLQDKILEDTFDNNIKNMKTHLLSLHRIENEHSKTLRTWLKLLNKTKKLGGFQKIKCTICENQTLRKMCSFKLIEHLENHGIPIPPDISSIGSMGKSSNSDSLLRSDENVENIPTSSGDSANPQPGSSRDDSKRKDLKRKSSSLLSSDKNVEDIPITSRGPQPGNSQSLDISADSDRDSGKKKVKYDDDKCSRDE